MVTNNLYPSRINSFSAIPQSLHLFCIRNGSTLSRYEFIMNNFSLYVTYFISFQFSFFLRVFFFYCCFHTIVLLTLNLDDIAWGFTLSFFERFRICLYKYLLIDLLVNDIIFRIDVVIIIFRLKSEFFIGRKKNYIELYFI